MINATEKSKQWRAKKQAEKFSAEYLGGESKVLPSYFLVAKEEEHCDKYYLDLCQFDPTVRQKFYREFPIAAVKYNVQEMLAHFKHIIKTNNIEKKLNKIK